MVAKECDAIACQRSSPRTAANCDERCRSQPKGISPRIPQRGLRKCCWVRLWIAFRLRLSGLLQLLDTLRNKLRRTLWHLRQQLRHSLRASKIRLRRTVRTDFLLRVPAALVLVIWARRARDRLPGIRRLAAWCAGLRTRWQREQSCEPDERSPTCKTDHRQVEADVDGKDHVSRGMH